MIQELSAKQKRARQHLNLNVGLGLEIGPLFTPLVRREDANVRYADIASADDLREHFADDPTVSINEIVDVDYVLLDEQGAAISLVEATRSQGRFDWVLASHVIEHVPDIIGWLKDVAEVLVDGGRLSLVIPDCRYTFDVLRPITTVGTMLQAHEQVDTTPSTRAVFDHFSSHVTVSTSDLWEGRRPDPGQATYTLEQALGVVHAGGAGKYMDSHVWVFTPRSFVQQLDILSQLSLLDFTIVAVRPTASYELEFYVTLERVPRGSSNLQNRDAFLVHMSKTHMAPPRLSRDAKSADGSEQPSDFSLSERERRLVMFKRRVSSGARKRLTAVRSAIR